MVDLTLQAPVLERAAKLTELGYNINYFTWPFTGNVGIPLPSTQVWEHDFGGKRLEAAYGLNATLKLLDEIIAWFQAKNAPKTCTCSTIDLFRQGCKC
jgi:hypothetical protein